MNALHSTRTTEELLSLIVAQQETIKRLSWNPDLDMFNGAGMREAIRTLAPARYIVTFFDINYLKQINTATGNHFATNRYLRDGLRVRRGEVIGQWLGDEFVAIIRQHSRRANVRADAFVARLAGQLARQPVPLSAMFATEIGVPHDAILPAIERLSIDVLARKAARDAAAVQA